MLFVGTEKQTNPLNKLKTRLLAVPCSKPLTSRQAVINASSSDNMFSVKVPSVITLLVSLFQLEFQFLFARYCENYFFDSMKTLKIIIYIIESLVKTERTSN